MRSDLSFNIWNNHTLILFTAYWFGLYFSNSFSLPKSMAAPESASNSLSPPSSGFSGGASHQNSRNMSSPTSWTHIVRGESEVVQAAPSSPPPLNSDFSSAAVKPALSSLASDDSSLDTNNGSNLSASTKKPPAWNWNKPSNCTITEVGPVMGAISWPALSDSTRPSTKSVSSQHQGPLIATSPNKQPIAATTNPNSVTNHAAPVRQKSTKRGSGGGPANAHAVFTHSPPPPSAATVDMPRNNSANPGATAQHSDSPHKGQKWDGDTRGGGGFSQRSNIVNDHPHQRASSFRRGNGGPHPHGDSSHPNYYAGRREHDRPTNHEWHPQRNINGRNVHLQQQQQHRVFPRTFMRHPPPGAGPFIGPPPPPPPVRPFGNPIAFPDMAMTTPVYYVPALPHEPFRVRGMPFIHATPPMYFPAPDPQLPALLSKQIDYYFSPENLCKDIFLRQNMDEQGWVPVSLIATFNRVKQLTNNTQMILDAVRTSTVVEVKGDKIRRRSDWMTWLLLPFNHSTSGSSPEPPHRPENNMLENHFQNVNLEEAKATSHDIKPPAHPPKGAMPSSGELNNQPQMSNNEIIGQILVRAVSDQSIATRSLSES